MSNCNWNCCFITCYGCLGWQGPDQSSSSRAPSWLSTGLSYFIPSKQIDKVSMCFYRIMSFQGVDTVIQNIVKQKDRRKLLVYSNFKAKMYVVFETIDNSYILKLPTCDSFWPDGSQLLLGLILGFTCSRPAGCFISNAETLLNRYKPSYIRLKIIHILLN